MQTLPFHDLSIIKTVSGIGFIICMLGKIGLHIYLDYAYKKISSLTVYIYTPAVFFKKYRTPVSAESEPARLICNSLLYAFYLLLAVNFTAGMLMLVIH